jgi:hypothetical protein
MQANHSRPLSAPRWGSACLAIGHCLRVRGRCWTVQHGLANVTGYSAFLGRALGTGRLADQAEGPRRQRPAEPLFKGGR